jgi:hypothetical protein
LDLQSHACAICGTPVVEGASQKHLRACADHCHETNRFRGILCGQCNSGLGLLQDDPKVIQSAIVWLTRQIPTLKEVPTIPETGSRSQKRERRRSRTRKGLNHEAVRKHLALQEHRCGICATFVTDAPEDIRQKACADHCHTTGVLRGVLCNRCNTALGMFKDSPERLAGAIRYLAVYLELCIDTNAHWKAC